MPVQFFVIYFQVLQKKVKFEVDVSDGFISFFRMVVEIDSFISLLNKTCMFYEIEAACYDKSPPLPPPPHNYCLCCLYYNFRI